MRILITGGFGYLGGRIAQSLVEQGHQVTLGSRREHEIPDWLPQAEVVKLVWDDMSVLQAACGNSDVVIHAAGMNAQDCTSDPVSAIEFNGVATARLVQASKMAGVIKFIYLSTAHVYRSPLIGEFTEESCPLNIHPYATSHIAGENAVLYGANDEEGFIGVVLRLSNGIGTPTHKDANCWMLAVNDFCRQTVEGGKIEVNAPRWIKRDFVPISLLCRIINTIVSNSEIESTIVNVSSSRTVNLQEMTNIIRKHAKLLLDLKVEIIFKNNELEENRSFLSIANSRLKKMIGIEAELEDEIGQLLLNCQNWFGR